jgi:putative Mn2+ efflux pump MntP
MSLHLFSIALISISSNTDSFAVAIAYGIKKVKITILANLSIAIVSSLGTFLSMSVGQMISGYLPQSIASKLGSAVLIVGAAMGEKFSRRMTESWSSFLSSGLIILIGIYEYFN